MSTSPSAHCPGTSKLLYGTVKSESTMEYEDKVHVLGRYIALIHAHFPIYPEPAVHFFLLLNMYRHAYPGLLPHFCRMFRDHPRLLTAFNLYLPAPDYRFFCLPHTEPGRKIVTLMTPDGNMQWLTDPISIPIRVPAHGSSPSSPSSALAAHMRAATFILRVWAHCPPSATSGIIAALSALFPAHLKTEPYAHYGHFAPGDAAVALAHKCLRRAEDVRTVCTLLVDRGENTDAGAESGADENAGGNANDVQGRGQWDDVKMLQELGAFVPEDEFLARAELTRAEFEARSRRIEGVLALAQSGGTGVADPGTSTAAVAADAGAKAKANTLTAEARGARRSRKKGRK